MKPNPVDEYDDTKPQTVGVELPNTLNEIFEDFAFDYVSAKTLGDETDTLVLGRAKQLLLAEMLKALPKKEPRMSTEYINYNAKVDARNKTIDQARQALTKLFGGEV